jgi:hypothetical protein
MWDTDQCCLLPGALESSASAASDKLKSIGQSEVDTARLSAPGLGVEFGSTHDHVMYALFQGLFLAPSLQYFILHFLAIELLNFLRPANR